MEPNLQLVEGKSLLYMQKCLLWKIKHTWSFGLSSFKPDSQSCHNNSHNGTAIFLVTQLNIQHLPLTLSSFLPSKSVNTPYSLFLWKHPWLLLLWPRSSSLHILLLLLPANWLPCLRIAAPIKNSWLKVETLTPLFSSNTLSKSYENHKGFKTLTPRTEILG